MLLLKKRLLVSTGGFFIFFMRGYQLVRLFFVIIANKLFGYDVCTYVYLYGKLFIMKNEKRVLKGYKIKDSVYQKALRRGKRTGYSLAYFIEIWVTLFAQGKFVGEMELEEFVVAEPKSNGGSK